MSGTLDCHWIATEFPLAQGKDMAWITAPYLTSMAILLTRRWRWVIYALVIKSRLPMSYIQYWVVNKLFCWKKLRQLQARTCLTKSFPTSPRFFLPVVIDNPIAVYSAIPFLTTPKPTGAFWLLLMCMQFFGSEICERKETFAGYRTSHWNTL